MLTMLPIQNEPLNPRQCFDRFYERLLNFIHFRVGRNRSLAEDLCQDVFLKIIRVQSRLDSQNPWGLLCKIAQDRIADQFRKQGKMEMTLGDLKELKSAIFEMESREVPQRVWEEREHSDAINRIFFSLPDRDQQVLELMYLEKLSVKEIAQRLGSTDKAVESQLSRARSRFRELAAKLLS